MEGPHLVGVRLDIGQIVLGPLELVDRHAPLDPPLDGGLLVMGEVHPGRRSHREKDAIESGLAHGEGVLQQCGGPLHVRVPADPRQLVRDLLGGQDEVDHPGGHGSVGHAAVAGRFFVLREGDPAFGLDRGQPQDAVGGRARQDHPDGPALPVLRQRAKKRVDRHPLAARLTRV